MSPTRCPVTGDWHFPLFLPSGSLLLLLIVVSESLSAQSFIKRLDHQDVSLGRRIAAFANGDVLIGDSSIEGLRDVSLDGKIYLTRVDACGAIVWSNTYHQTDVYLEFKDFKINDAGEIFVYGSAYRNNFEELIYLLKVLPDGSMEKFNLFRTGTVDHFSYNIDIQDGRILCYGLLLDFGTQKQGFVSIFDEALNFDWGIKFAPFETGGEAIFTSEGNIMCRSDAFLINLDQDGQLNWARELNVEDVGVPISGPIEIPGGFVFQGYRDGQSFFYQVNRSGRLEWISDQISSTEHAADFTLTDRGELLVSFSSPIAGENRLTHCLLSATGDILAHRYLDLDKSMNVAHTSSVLFDRRVTVLANASLFDIVASGLDDFILQFSLDTLSTDCFTWSPLDNRSAYSKDLVLTEYDTIILPNDMTLDVAVRAYTMPEETSYLPICDSIVFTEDQLIDTLLDCAEDWQVTLPTNGFFWEDGYANSQRLMEKAGIYRARNKSCSDPIVVTYQLDRPGCNCNIYLPNAITPNGDGINDELKLFSDCTLTAWELRVYDRWGKQILFASSGSNGWDGTFGDQSIAPGLLVVQADYRVVDEGGVEQTGQLYQELQLIR